MPDDLFETMAEPDGWMEEDDKYDVSGVVRLGNVVCGNESQAYRKRVLRELTRLADRMSISISTERVVLFLRRYFEATHFVRSESKRRALIAAAAYILSTQDGDGPTMELYAQIASQRKEKFRRLVEVISYTLSLKLPPSNLHELFKTHTRNACQMLMRQSAKTERITSRQPTPALMDDSTNGNETTTLSLTAGPPSMQDEVAEEIDFDMADPTTTAMEEFDQLLSGSTQLEDESMDFLIEVANLDDEEDDEWWSQVSDAWALCSAQLASLEDPRTYDFAQRPERKGRERERSSLVHIAAVLLVAARQNPFLSRFVSAEMLASACRLQATPQRLCQVAREKIMFLIDEAVNLGFLSTTARHSITSTEIRYGSGRVKLAISFLIHERFGASHHSAVTTR